MVPFCLAISQLADSMKLLSFSLWLEAETGQDFAVRSLPFLGGMLHGAWEDQVYRHAPGLKPVLGIASGQSGNSGTPKRYAILPPPWAQPLSLLDEGTAQLGFGVMLYGAAADHASELAAAFSRCPSLRLGARQDRIEQCRFCEYAPRYSGDFSALGMIHLHWITPLLLDSAGQRARGVDQHPPDLLRVVRSIARRIRDLEPELAEQLGLQGSAWVMAEEAIRTLRGHSADWQKVSWRYGSRTKEAPFPFSGQLGLIGYLGNGPDSIPAPIHSLLQWGTWFGVGQRTALGQGFYRID